MANILFIKIDLSRIDNSRLFAGKNGAKYLDLVCVPTRDSKYGDTHFITQSCSKEERQTGTKMPIIGNAKEQPPRGSDNDRSRSRPARNETPTRQEQSTKPAAQENIDEDPPF